MKIRHGFALLLTLVAAEVATAQQRSYVTQKSSEQRVAAKSRVSHDEDADSQDTTVQAPVSATIGSSKGTNAPGGDYGLGQPLCAPQISLSPKSNCTKGQHWWCEPWCGFESWGCGTPVRTAFRNTKTQLNSLIPCGPWCQSRGCNCSGQGPYVMDWSQPDRRSCACDCKGSHYLFPWIWNYNPSRKGCCINRWTQRGDGYRSALQFNQQEDDLQFPYEQETPAPPPSVMDQQTTSKTAKTNMKMKNISHETGGRKPEATVVREVAPQKEVAAKEAESTVTDDLMPKKPAPTGVLSANYLARLVPKTKDEEATRVAGPSKEGSSRRR